MKELLQSKDKVIREIENAFSHVKLGNGIGLWEAQAIDDYASNEEQKLARDKDEKKDWKSLNSNVLQKCNSSLSFFDAEGMKFHLPAFIIASMNNTNMLDPIFHLTYLSSYTKEQLSALNTIQRKAIITYLKWCLSNIDYEFEHNNIEIALNLYWEK
ncbi:MAG TPA: hypothetical protein ENK39_01825 [Epsilonproteobacteria bacterium]|nr:hypothetical protein [Campylobacterota bacterium]